ncbi:MAG: hypothetical protein RLO50_14630 [Azospirillaceae bacterium]
MRAVVVRLLLIVPFLAACVPAAEEPRPLPVVEASIEDFYGYWQGATTEGSDQSRAAFVLVEPTEQGFRITWRNVSASGDGGVVQRESELRFASTEDPNRWTALQPPDSPIAISAEMVDDTLHIRLAATNEDGLLEEQIYDRRIVGNFLVLDYRRLVDGEERRQLEARYVRTDI